jgi:UDP-N-acetylmuramate dehydrogenase
MKILKNVSLALYSTMRLGGKAQFLAHVTSEADLAEALAWAKERGVATTMIGTGANIIFSDKGVKGLVLVNDIKGIDINGTTLVVGAGEIWDDVVAASVKHELNGIAALSKIPGKAGAAPVQNIGAYGEVIAQTLVEVRAYDCQKNTFVDIANKDSGPAALTDKIKAALLLPK